MTGIAAGVVLAVLDIAAVHARYKVLTGFDVEFPELWQVMATSVPVMGLLVGWSWQCRPACPWR